MSLRDWNAASYDRVGSAMTAMGLEVLDRVALRGEETVLDAGCGTGAITQEIVRQLPRGRVIAVDASPDMVAQTRRRLGQGADVLQADLLDLELHETVDIVFSTATFHWILDHEALFERLRAVLAPGGRLVAQCGGEGNLARFYAEAQSLAAQAPYKDQMAGYVSPHRFASPAQTEQILLTTGFSRARCWLTEVPVVPEDPHEYMRTIILAPVLERLSAPRASRFMDELLQRLPTPLELDYVRLNIDAV